MPSQNAKQDPQGEASFGRGSGGGRQAGSATQLGAGRCAGASQAPVSPLRLPGAEARTPRLLDAQRAERKVGEENPVPHARSPGRYPHASPGLPRTRRARVLPPRPRSRPSPRRRTARPSPRRGSGAARRRRRPRARLPLPGRGAARLRGLRRPSSPGRPRRRGARAGSPRAAAAAPSEAAAEPHRALMAASRRHVRRRGPHASACPFKARHPGGSSAFRAHRVPFD